MFSCLFVQSDVGAEFLFVATVYIELEKFEQSWNFIETFLAS